MPEEPDELAGRTDDERYSVYANNTFFEPSVWDLKILFGQLEQNVGKSGVDWHSAVTIPWIQAKILLYYIRVNIALHEQHDGPIHVPSRVIPAKPVPLTSEQESEPGAVELHKLVNRIHTEMFG